MKELFNKELFAALAKAQADMATAGLNSANPFFKSKYADLAEIVNASRPLLPRTDSSVSLSLTKRVLIYSVRFWATLQDN